MLRLPNDHTAGTRAGMPTPNASVADNDLAVGRAVEAVSHSPYWNDTRSSFWRTMPEWRRLCGCASQHGNHHQQIRAAAGNAAGGSPLLHHGQHGADVKTCWNATMNITTAFAPRIAAVFAGAATSQRSMRITDRDKRPDLHGEQTVGSGAKESAKIGFPPRDRADPQN